MELRSFDELAAYAGKAARKRVVVAAAHDHHALEAVFAAAREGIADYLLVGDAARITAISEELGTETDPRLIVDAANDEEAAAKAVALIREGSGDFLMKGKLETAVLLRATLNRETGIRTESTMTHVALVDAPAYPKLLAVTDGGMIPHPTLEQKKWIVQNAVSLFRALGYERPRVAALAASETPNERQPETLDAAALKEMARDGLFGACELEGPISFDLTVSEESARIKGYESPVTGQADILVAPNMVCGNVLTKSMIYMANARMAGVVMGARVPIILVSRGATAEEKRLSILLAAASAGR